MRLKFKLIQISTFGILTIGLIGCGEPEKPTTQPEEQPKEKKALDPEKAALFKVGDELFSIPSPVQTAFMLKKAGASYSKNMLNDPKKIASYATRFQRSVNLGVYGADLGYSTIYDQTPDAISYINSTKKLADELGVTSAFNPELMARFESNLENQDSLLSIMGDAYKESNRFFQNSDQEQIGALVLCGGWVEALYFSTSTAQNSGSAELKKRVAEQKGSLENLVKLLQRHADNEEIADFVAELIDLYYLFDEVESTYVWKEPTTDEASQTTTINSVTEANITDEQLTTIAAKVESIRNHIIG